jgi:hypothetical protein
LLLVAKRGISFCLLRFALQPKEPIWFYNLTPNKDSFDKPQIIVNTPVLQKNKAKIPRSARNDYWDWDAWRKCFAFSH